MISWGLIVQVLMLSEINVISSTKLNGTWKFLMFVALTIKPGFIPPTAIAFYNDKQVLSAQQQRPGLSRLNSQCKNKWQILFSNVSLRSFRFFRLDKKWTDAIEV